jgi:ribosomal protein S18 acetylase RimI-like enzyme
MSNKKTFRALRRSDFKRILEIYQAGFSEEFGRRGVDIAAQVGRWEKLYGLFAALKLFPNPYQFALNVDVLEIDNTIVGFIQTSPGNQTQTRWHIDFVAVHPDYRGLGYAQLICEKMFERYSAKGVRHYTLEVDIENIPARKLYEKLGFRHYNEITYYRLDGVDKINHTTPEELLSNKAKLKPYTNHDATGVANLYQELTPLFARTVDTKTAKDFKVTLKDKGLLLLRNRLQGMAESRYVIRHSHHTVGYLKLNLQLKRHLPHTIQFFSHPAYLEDVSSLAILDLALKQIVLAAVSRPILAWSVSTQESKKEALLTRGFEPISTDLAMVKDHLANIKLVTPENARPEDSALKPAYSHEVKRI